MPIVKKITNQTATTIKARNTTGNRRGRPRNQEKVSVYTFTDKKTGIVTEIATSLKDCTIYGPNGEIAQFVRVEYRDIPTID